MVLVTCATAVEGRTVPLNMTIVLPDNTTRIEELNVDQEDADALVAASGYARADEKGKVSIT